MIVSFINWITAGALCSDSIDGAGRSIDAGAIKIKNTDSLAKVEANRSAVGSECSSDIRNSIGFDIFAAGFGRLEAAR